jgi:hypothetical protein
MNRGKKFMQILQDRHEDERIILRWKLGRLILRKWFRIMSNFYFFIIVVQPTGFTGR